MDDVNHIPVLRGDAEAPDRIIEIIPMIRQPRLRVSLRDLKTQRGPVIEIIEYKIHHAIPIEAPLCPILLEKVHQGAVA